MIAAFEAAITRVHDEPGVELYALHKEPDRLVMIEKHESEQARSEHLKGAALAGLRSALDANLSGTRGPGTSSTTVSSTWVNPAQRRVLLRRCHRASRQLSSCKVKTY